MTKEFFLDKRERRGRKKERRLCSSSSQSEQWAGNERLSTFKTRPSPMDISFLSTSALLQSKLSFCFKPSPFSTYHFLSLFITPLFRSSTNFSFVFAFCFSTSAQVFLHVLPLFLQTRIQTRPKRVV